MKNSKLKTRSAGSWPLEAGSWKLEAVSCKLAAGSRKPEAGRWTLAAGFTLVELMIVVAILGILAAIVFPEFQNYQQKAKEAQAKANLKLLREAIERYTADHGVPPGYPNNISTLLPNYSVFTSQLVGDKLYLSEIPKNPFSNLQKIHMFSNNVEVMVSKPILTSVFGWIYHAKTKTIKLNWNGTDSEGIRYFDY